MIKLIENYPEKPMTFNLKVELYFFTENSQDSWDKKSVFEAK